MNFEHRDIFMDSSFIDYSFGNDKEDEQDSGEIYGLGGPYGEVLFCFRGPILALLVAIVKKLYYLNVGNDQ